MTSKEIRESFLCFFERYGHTRINSSSLVPINDQTLLFVNAGMNQFKKIFLGEEEYRYNRVVSCQKCIRAGGKHNDLDNIGFTRRHNTFFEMLGNFSFGNSIKEDTIEMVWKLLTINYKFHSNSIWVTVFNKDEETALLWQKITDISSEHIISLDEKHNFWTMGDTGPCGPCSEIIIDQGKDMTCGPNCGIGICNCDRYLEIWNIVFMQFNRTKDGELHNLHKLNIDTGIGLERLTSVIQGVNSNFDTDLFIPIIAKIEELSKCKYTGSYNIENTSIRVIADHSRAAIFLVADGVLPFNEGHGYVLRRIIRRAIRFGRILGIKSPFMNIVGATVVDIMKDIYPDLKNIYQFFLKVVNEEEEKFSNTLDYGLNILNEELNLLESKNEKIFPGTIAFRLYDTHGFPIDLIRDILRERDFKLDMKDFRNHLYRQKEASRIARNDSVNKELSLNLNDIHRLKPTKFSGYEILQLDSIIIALFDQENNSCIQAKKNELVKVITESTTFYGESGGQVGDTGWITSFDCKLQVIDTNIVFNKFVIHNCIVDDGIVKVNDLVHMDVNEERRYQISRNHTATHILHSLLKKHLGNNIKQFGSYISPEKLRFDFNYFKNIDYDKLKEIEFDMNRIVINNLHIKVISINDLNYNENSFSESTYYNYKYKKYTRSVVINGISNEFCKGTHVIYTGNLGLCKITSVYSVSSNIRRIEIITGLTAIDTIQKSYADINKMSGILRTNSNNLLTCLEKLLTKQKELKEQIKFLTNRLFITQSFELLDKVHYINNIPIIYSNTDAFNYAQLRNISSKLLDRLKTGVIVLISIIKDKYILIVMVSSNLNKYLSAIEIMKRIISTIGGNGGGNEVIAEAGGLSIEKLYRNLKLLVYETIKQMVNNHVS